MYLRRGIKRCKDINIPLFFIIKTAFIDMEKANS